jgi:hypothetical protein
MLRNISESETEKDYHLAVAQLKASEIWCEHINFQNTWEKISKASIINA